MITANNNAPEVPPTLWQLLQLSVLVEQVCGREAAARVFRLLREEMRRQECQHRQRLIKDAERIIT